jgi:hypothetical protein
MPDTSTHHRILAEIHDSYIRKDTDYGSSFAQMFAEFGLLSTVIRLSDKLGRLKTLTQQEALVKDESIRDTLMDLANYAVMTVMELDNRINKG